MEPVHLGIAAGVIAAIAAGVVLVRRARLSGAIRTQTGSCQGCGRPGPVLEASLHQNTGMLFARRHTRADGTFCRSCGVTTALKMNLHNLVLGWWGTISMIVTPLFFLNNLYYGLAAASLPSAERISGQALDGEREYALNLLATKDPATVVEVLSKKTGASEEAVVEFLKRIKSAA